MKRVKLLLFLLVIFILPIVVNAEDIVNPNSTTIDIDNIEIGKPPTYAKKNNKYVVLSEQWRNLTDETILNRNSIIEANKIYQYRNISGVYFYPQKFLLDNMTTSPYYLAPVNYNNRIYNYYGFSSAFLSSTIFYTGDKNDLKIVDSNDITINKLDSFDVGSILKDPTYQATDNISSVNFTWLNENDEVINVEDNYRIKDGDIIKLEIGVFPKLGYTFKDSFTLNNENNNYIDSNLSSSSYNYRAYTYKYEFHNEVINGKQIIKSADYNYDGVFYDEPLKSNDVTIDGLHIYDTTKDTNSIDECHTSMTGTHCTTKIYVEITDQNNYEFADNFKLNLIGNYKNEFYLNESEWIKETKYKYVKTINYQIDLLDDTIYDFYINTPYITLGDKIPSLTTTHSSNQHNNDKVNYKAQFYQNENPVEYGSIFEYDQTYTYKIIIEPKSGYKLSPKFHIYIHKLYQNNEPIELNESKYFNSITEGFNEDGNYEINIKYNIHSKYSNEICAPITIDMDRPVMGEKLTYAKKNSTSEYTIEDKWLDSNMNELDSNTVFEWNKNYYYQIKIIPKEGYSFCDYNYLINIPALGMNNVVINTGSPGKIAYNTNYTSITNIEYKNYNFLPEIDEFYQSAELDKQYIINNFIDISSKWYDSEEKLVTSSFKENEQYKLKINLKTKPGYFFSNNLTVNDAYLKNDDFYKNSTVEKINDYEVLITYTFELIKDENTIYDFEGYEIPNPQIGRKFPYVENKDDRVDYIQNWYILTGDYTYKLVSKDDLVKRNEMYVYETIAIPKNGKKLSNRTKIININILPDYYYDNNLYEPYYLEKDNLETTENQLTETYRYETTVKEGEEIFAKKIELNKNELYLVKETNESLVATLDSDYVTDYTITWNSNDETVATVDSRGKVTAISPGKTLITATSSNGKTATCTVTVTSNEIEVTNITLNKKELTLIIGNNETLTATITPSNATNNNTTWTSSNPEVATVNNGKVTAISSGTTTITATTSNGKTASCTVEVITEEDSKLMPVYRMYNPRNGEHLYTTDKHEAEVIYRTQGWGKEGIGWYSKKSGTAVYRLYSPKFDNHLYTSDQNEMNIITSKYGWVFDNVINGVPQPVMYSDGDTKIYRLYNPAQNDQHHLTTDENEYNIIPKWGWKQEGVAMQAAKIGKPETTHYYK